LETWWEHALAPARIAAERKGLTFAASAKSLSVHASVDSVRLQQVVQNLLNNAIKFTSSGRIEVTAAYLPALEDESQPATLRVEVCDSGPGLTQADREVLFTPYAQGAQGRLARHGAGLGLAISRQIVQAMGGQLNAEVSASGTGACFVLLVPLAVESTTVALTPVAAPWQDDLVVTARGS
jgi:signal transduction histidine kinase